MEERVSDDFYTDGEVLFCNFCDHSVDYVRVDTIKDHLKSKKHRQRKDLKEADTSSRGRKQVTLTTLIKSKDLRVEFVLDFIKMSTMVEIPLEKMERMRPFLLKCCKQAGTLPKASTLRSQYVPRAFEGHFIALKDLLKESAPALVHLTADETTDVRDQSILNILATIRGKSYLIGFVRLDACNHSAFSRVIMKCVAEVDIPYEPIHAFITDSAAYYCKKEYREVLSSLFPRSTHVLCLAHIVNLAADVFQKYNDFHHVATPITMIKIKLFKKTREEITLSDLLKRYNLSDRCQIASGSCIN